MAPHVAISLNVRRHPAQVPVALSMVQILLQGEGIGIGGPSTATPFMEPQRSSILNRPVAPPARRSVFFAARRSARGAASVLPSVRLESDPRLTLAHIYDMVMTQ
jgi:hypothetical protein